ncbi:MAG TPA: hypothetical protein VJH21_00810 [Candidatus Paceibacterota bacterium]
MRKDEDGDFQYSKNPQEGTTGAIFITTILLILLTVLLLYNHLTILQRNDAFPADQHINNVTEADLMNGTSP